MRPTSWRSTPCPASNSFRRRASIAVRTGRGFSRAVRTAARNKDSACFCKPDRRRCVIPGSKNRHETAWEALRRALPWMKQCDVAGISSVRKTRDYLTARSPAYWHRRIVESRAWLRLVSRIGGEHYTATQSVASLESRFTSQSCRSRT